MSANSELNSKPTSFDSSSVTPKEFSTSSNISLLQLINDSCDWVRRIELSPRGRDLIMWKNPKYTAAVFGSSLVMLLSLASFSLLTVTSTALLVALTLAGAYRFYLAFMLRFKGTHDPCFEKLTSSDVTVPKEKIEKLAHIIETDLNRFLNQLKFIVLWEDVTTSLFALISFYVVYTIGAVFNTLTLLIIGHVSLFTLPKIYRVYQAPIDKALTQAHQSADLVWKQALTKLPFLHKKGLKAE